MSSSSDWGPASPRANSPWSSGSSELEGHYDIKCPDGTKKSSSKSSTPVTSERRTRVKTPMMPARGQDRWYQPAYPSPSDPWGSNKEKNCVPPEECRSPEQGKRIWERRRDMQPWFRGSKCLRTGQSGN